MPECPFCGSDPYHYVNNGVGMEAVAVVCCDDGAALHSAEPPADVLDAGGRLANLLAARSAIDETIEHLREKWSDRLAEADRARLTALLSRAGEVINDLRAHDEPADCPNWHDHCRCERGGISRAARQLSNDIAEEIGK